MRSQRARAAAELSPGDLHPFVHNTQPAFIGGERQAEVIRFRFASGLPYTEVGCSGCWCGVRAASSGGGTAVLCTNELFVPAQEGQVPFPRCVCSRVWPNALNQRSTLP